MLERSWEVGGLGKLLRKPFVSTSQVEGSIIIATDFKGPFLHDFSKLPHMGFGVNKTATTTF